MLGSIWFYSLVTLALSAPAGDLVTNLPGLLFTPTFNHYSGYLQAAPTRMFHYWFTESMRNPTTAPLVLWLNGGPGCSSVGGLIEELGPFHISNYGQSVYLNQWAWNNYFNVLFIESPAGVGYSYSTDGNVTVNDDDVARQNHAALVDFLNKFPEYKGRNFYITGESYGGIYLPTLAVQLINDKTNFPNFKGMAVGNGLLSFPLNDDTLPSLYYYHGLVRDEMYQKIRRQCCDGDVEDCNIDTARLKSVACETMISEVLGLATDNVDPYNLYENCYMSPNGPGKLSFIQKNIITHVNQRPLKRVESASKAQVDASGTTPTPPLCSQEDNTAIYMNRADARKALHIPSSLPKWSDCSNKISVTYKTIYKDMKQQVSTIQKAGVRMLFYNGDVDTICNGVMNMKFLTSLGYTVLGPERVNSPWKYSGEGNGDTAAGTQLSYAGGIDYLTVRGSGHFVPGDRPREALQMIYNFVNQQDYSTPVPV